MSERQQSQDAPGIWDALKAIHEVCPAITDDLASELWGLAGTDHANWVACLTMWKAFCVAQHPTMSAAVCARDTTHARLQRQLAERKDPNCTRWFSQWIFGQSELLGKVVGCCGLQAWPYLGLHYGDIKDTGEETLGTLLSLVAHPDVAKLLSDRFARLREAIRSEC